jgi:hypothetical protein
MSLMSSVCTIVAEVVTRDGDAVWRGVDRTEYQSTPASSFAEWQPGTIGVNVAHQGPTIGHVDYLECRPDSHNGSLMAVAVVDATAELVDGLFASPELRANSMFTVERHSYRLDRRRESYGTLTATTSVLDGVGLVSSTAGVTSTRVRAFAGDYRDVIDWGAIMSRRPPHILERAKAAAPWNLRTSRPHKLRIHRPAELRVDDLDLEVRSGRVELQYTAPYPGVLSVRSA